jgi:hypothetical protein
MKQLYDDLQALLDKIVAKNAKIPYEMLICRNWTGDGVIRWSSL